MRTVLAIVAVTCFFSTAGAQRLHLGVFGGVSSYGGELTDRVFPKKLTHVAAGLTGNYDIAPHFMLRAGLTYATVEGADKYSRDTFSVHRNLSFKSHIAELSALGEFYLFDLNNKRYSPYIFAGVAVFHFNPYAFDVNGAKVRLKPLSTEGQGIAGYSDRQPYSLMQFSVPFGGGFKYVINSNFRIGIEVGLRKLFTDYLDDVSTSYVALDDLYAARGQLAVDMAYRGDEVEGGSPDYPGKGAQRGGSKIKDYYYFGGLHLTYLLGAENNSTGSGGKAGKQKMGCPKVY